MQIGCSFRFSTRLQRAPAANDLGGLPIGARAVEHQRDGLSVRPRAIRAREGTLASADHARLELAVPSASLSASIRRPRANKHEQCEDPEVRATPEGVETNQ